MKIKIEVSPSELDAMGCDSIAEFEQDIRHQLDKGVVTDDGGNGTDWMVDYELEIALGGDNNKFNTHEEKEVGWHTLLVGQSGQPKSMLADLTQSERDDLNLWLAEQTGDPERGGCIDVMRWTGWGAVVERRAKESSAT